MKRIKYHVIGIFILVMANLCLFGQETTLRKKINLNREWRFCLGDDSIWAEPKYADSGWQRINIPHNFSIPYFQAAKWYTGYGWYRKHFNVPANWKSRQIFIEFDGAFREAEIFINGTRIGMSQSGYTGFSFDMTSAIKPGDNVLAVRLNNNWNAQLAPLNGDHNFTGGIYRDVRLVATDPVHVTWYGTFVTTPKLSEASGLVNIKTEVKNDGKESKSYLLKTSIIDPDGKIVKTVSSSLFLQAGKTGEFNQTTQPVLNPRLWHPLHPDLYKVKSVLYHGKIALDQYETFFGFRWMEWTADHGFFLNGAHYYFKGVNAHQDHAGWASAITHTAMLRDVKMVKEAGFDFIRGSHYPHAPYYAQACDSLGMLFWSENNFWGCGGFALGGSWFKSSPAYPVNVADRENFEKSLKNSLRDMIRINRNHPSIITWSMSNEPFFSNQSDLDRIREFMKELTALSHELDPTRAVAAGGVQRGELDKTGDIAGYNGDGARLYIEPGIPSVVSEYGSTVADRPGKYEPGFGDLADQPQFGWRSGQAIWCAFDYGTHAGQLGHMGIIDYQRIPKRAWYWYRNEYKKIPPPEWPKAGIAAALKLTADKNTIQPADGTDDVHLMVTVLDADGQELSNAPDVKFTLISGPGEFPTGSEITFSAKSEIPILDGKAAIEFRSYYAGTSMIKASSPGLKDAFITIFSKSAPLYTAAVQQQVTERPYVKFEERELEPKAVSNTNFALNKPTRASSELQGHSGRYVNDQDLKTYWSASQPGAGQWLTIDLENAIILTSIRLDFLKSANFKYKLQVSADGEVWQDVADQSHTASIDLHRVHQLKTDFAARWFRMVFTGMPSDATAAITEIEIHAKK